MKLKIIGLIAICLLGAGCKSGYNKSILDGYRNTVVTMESLIQDENANTNGIIISFEAVNLKNDFERARPYYDTAMWVKKYLDSLNASVKEIEDGLIGKVGGYDKIYKDYSAMGNTSISTDFLLKQKKASELKKKIQVVKAEVEILLTDYRIKEKFHKLFMNNTVDSTVVFSDESWEITNFSDQLPLIAVIANLTRIKAGIIQCERNLMGMILSGGGHSIIINRFDVFAHAPSSTVKAGQPYTAEIYFTSVSPERAMKVLVNDKSVPIINGKGVYSITPSKEGVYKWSGIVTLTIENGQFMEYLIPEQTYTVIK